MTKEQLSELIAKLKEDSGLREKLKGATDIEAAAKIAMEAGFSFSEEELKPYLDQLLDDAELESISGGGTGYPCSGTCYNADCKTAKGAYGCDTYTGQEHCIRRCQ